MNREVQIQIESAPTVIEQAQEEFRDINRRKVYGIAAGSTVLLGMAEIGWEAWKHKNGEAIHSAVALDAEHNLALDSLYYLSLAGTEAQKRVGRFLGRIAAPITLIAGGVASAANAANNLMTRDIGAGETASGILGSPALAAAGNIAITAYVIAATRESQHADDAEAVEHAVNDRNSAAGKALGAAIHPLIDIWTGTKYGYRDAKLGIKRIARSLVGQSDDGTPQTHCHDDNHSHNAHVDEVAHDHGHQDNREPPQDLLSLAAGFFRGIRHKKEHLKAKIFSQTTNAAIRVKDYFVSQAETGERRFRWNRAAVAGIGSMALAGAGYYAMQRLGIGAEPSPLASGSKAGSPLEFLDPIDPPDLLEVPEFEAPPGSQASPEARDFVEVQLPEWDSETGRGSVWGELRHEYPDLSDAAINDLADRALDLNGLNEETARQLQPYEKVLLPVP